MPPRLAVLIPCFNEEPSIAAVVRDFALALPGASVYVYDNNSTDESRAVAAGAGAIVCSESRQGKGHAVRSMFREIEADIYVLVDGDDTYHASSATAMVQTLREEQLDMVVGSRMMAPGHVWRRGHRTGNRFFTRAISILFSRPLTDVLSGYRVFSRRFVESFDGTSEGFEIEAELTLHALVSGLPMREMETPYRSRPEGSVSKLATWSDGLRILRFIVRKYYARTGRTTSPATSVRRKSRP